MAVIPKMRWNMKMEKKTQLEQEINTNEQTEKKQRGKTQRGKTHD